MEYSFYLLEKRDRSIGEMEEKLSRREYQTDEISNTLEFLISKEFLNDRRFAQNYIRSRKIIKPTGKHYLRGKLIQKKVPADIIDQVLSDQPDEKSEVEEATDRWLSKHQNVPGEKRYEKLSRHLISRGFDWEKIKEVMSEKLKSR